MRPNRAVDEELKQVCPQHVPVVVVVLLAVLAAHHEAADATMSEESLVYGEVSEIFLDCLPFLGVEWLTRLDGIECRGRVSGVAGKGIWRQTGRQLITHSTTVRRSGGSAPLVTRTCSVGGMVRTNVRPDTMVFNAGKRCQEYLSVQVPSIRYPAFVIRFEAAVTAATEQANLGPWRVLTA